MYERTNKQRIDGWKMDSEEGWCTYKHKACSAVCPLSSLREGLALQAAMDGRLPHLASAAVDVGAQPPPPRCYAPPAVCWRHICSPQQIGCTHHTHTSVTVGFAADTCLEHFIEGQQKLAADYQGQCLANL